MSVLKLFFLNFTLVILTPNNFLFFRFSYPIPTRILFFYFFKTLLQLVKFSLGIPYQLLSFLVLYSFDYDFEFTSYRWELWLRYNFSISYFRFWISTCFSIVDYTLCLFNSLSILLFINNLLCLCKVWFMLVLAILRLSDVFSFVLGVVYRLGLK